jgi:hypothetical protein
MDGRLKLGPHVAHTGGNTGIRVCRVVGLMLSP